MARIRSIHPDLFLDEAFVSLSAEARIFMIGLWTESDDHGAFEWQPSRLRFKILPGDSVSGENLLGELERANIVKKVEIDGRSYGLVRNFCRFQRPKKPTFKVELPAEHRNFVALKADGSLPEHYHITGLTQEVGGKAGSGRPPVTHQAATGTEIPAQEKEEGGRLKRKEKPSTNKSESVVVVVPDAKPASTTTTTQAKIAPQGKASGGLGGLIGTSLPADWVPDEASLAKVFSDFGMTTADVNAELPAFHALNVSNGTMSLKWSDTFYLFAKRWKERQGRAAPARVELSKSSAPFVPTDKDWEKAAAFYARNGVWMRDHGPDPTSPACLCPPEILEKHMPNPAAIPVLAKVTS